MAGPTSPGTEGPTFAPPPLPPGWIAQWDGASRKYYFVQLSTGVSQWDTPTEAAPTGSTPAQPAEHPYGTPQPEVITHPDGSQTVRHADGTMEPILPSDGSRGVDGPSGERGFGSMAMNALLSGGKQHGGGGQNSSPFALAGQLFGGSSHGGGHGGGSGGSNPAGKLVGSLVSSLVTPSNKPAQPQNYYGGQNSQQPQNTGGLAGAVMGGVAHMFGGKPAQTQQSFGYSNSGNSGGYTGQAPPTSYQPPGSSAQYTAPAANAPSGTPSYQAPSSEPQAQYYQQPPPGQPQQQHGASYGPPSGQPQQSTPYTSYPPPNPQHPLPSAYGQPGVQHGTSHPQNTHGGNHPGGHPPPHHQQPYAPQQQYAAPPTGQYAAPQSNYNAPYSHPAGSAPPGASYAGQPPYHSPPPPGASY